MLVAAACGTCVQVNTGGSGGEAVGTFCTRTSFTTSCSACRHRVHRRGGCASRSAHWNYNILNLSASAFAFAFASVSARLPRGARLAALFTRLHFHTPLFVSYISYRSNFLWSTFGWYVFNKRIGRSLRAIRVE